MIHESACEASVAPAATEVSFPYALGIIIGLSPNGIAKEAIVQTTTVSDIAIGVNCLITKNTPININGNTIKRTSETT